MRAVTTEINVDDLMDSGLFRGKVDAEGALLTGFGGALRITAKDPESITSLIQLLQEIAIGLSIAKRSAAEPVHVSVAAKAVK